MHLLNTWNLQFSILQRSILYFWQLLREKFARKTVGDEGIGARYFPMHEREKLVTQLEDAQQQVNIKLRLSICIYFFYSTVVKKFQNALKRPI